MVVFGHDQDGSGTGPNQDMEDLEASPLFFGGDMRRMDNFTHSLLTNSDLLWLNHASTQSA